MFDDIGGFALVLGLRLGLGLGLGLPMVLALVLALALIDEVELGLYKVILLEPVRVVLERGGGGSGDDRDPPKDILFLLRIDYEFP